MTAVRLTAGLGIAAVLLALLALGIGSRLAVDALWFHSLGYGVIFRTALLAKLACFGAAFAISFPLLAFAGLQAVPRGTGIPRIVLRRGNGSVTIPELIAPITDRIPWRALVGLIAALLSVLFSLGQIGGWETWLLWLRGGSFGETDPLFGRDIGFYLFTLPAWRSLFGSATALLVLAGMLSAAVFWLQGALDVRRQGLFVPESAVRLLSLLLGIFFLVKAGDYWLGRYELLLRPGGAVFGAGYTAVHVRLPLQWILCTLSLGAAGLCLANLAIGGWRFPVAAVVAVVGTSIVASIVPDFYQRLRVRPDELRLERPYIEHNLRMTRLAYGLGAIEQRPFAASTDLDASAIERNRGTFGNVRLWDPRPLLDTYRQLQVIRLYYDFHDVDIDRYSLAGGRRQVMLAAREIVPEQLPANARTWVNQRLQFTHGFGAVMSPVTEFEGEGLPKFLLQDIPPRSSIAIDVAQPRIYFGERTDDYVIVGGAAPEFDYPKGEGNVSNSYDGKDGVGLGSWLRRILFAWSFGDLNILISANVRGESRVLFHRAIQQRISHLAPFLRLDADPYLVIASGRLYWIQDAYTMARTFPYSEPLRELGLNYIRNPVKIVVDAYDGTVDFYAIDEKEPVLAAYARIFPGTFKPYTGMPAELKEHVRYPESLFLVQAEVYRSYHMTNPDVFYNKEDLWNFPTETVGDSAKRVDPYYVIMKLPGEEREEFILMQPMTPSNRNNMVAWLAARCDAPHYGRLVEYQFPKERLIYGPQQIEARIDQDTLISQQLSLWNQMGSKVIRGNLLVIPVEDSVVYVEPLYLRSEQGQIPELKRVIASYADRVAMEPTLEAALAAVLGARGAPATPSPPVAAPPSTARKPAGPPPTLTARQHYEAALEGLRRGDWSAFAREMEALDRSLGADGEATPAEAPQPR